MMDKWPVKSKLYITGFKYIVIGLGGPIYGSVMGTKQIKTVPNKCVCRSKCWIKACKAHTTNLSCDFNRQFLSFFMSKLLTVGGPIAYLVVQVKFIVHILKGQQINMNSSWQKWIYG
jgi:hypothetical protein